MRNVRTLVVFPLTDSTPRPDAVNEERVSNSAFSLQATQRIESTLLRLSAKH